MWKEIVISNTESFSFKDPVKKDLLTVFEERLGMAIPKSLKSCLSESDGIFGEYQQGLIWPIDRIIHDNLEFRNDKDFKELYMPFNHILFFADAGNGDQFFYPVQAGEIRKNDIFVWNHEDDSRSWIAPSLEKYLEWWLIGKIEI